MAEIKDTFGGRKPRTAREVSDAFRAESPENERLYQEADARHAAEERTKATDGDWFDLENVKAMLKSGKPIGVHVQQRMADEIAYLRKREAYLVAELNACTHIPTGDKDDLE